MAEELAAENCRRSKGDTKPMPRLPSAFALLCVNVLPSARRLMAAPPAFAAAAPPPPPAESQAVAIHRQLFQQALDQELAAHVTARSNTKAEGKRGIGFVSPLLRRQFIRFGSNSHRRRSNGTVLTGRRWTPFGNRPVCKRGVPFERSRASANGTELGALGANGARANGIVPFANGRRAQTGCNIPRQDY